jgi:signal transduction histidine kinase
VLDDLGLAPALQTLAREAVPRAPTLHVTVDAPPTMPGWPPAVANALYFAAQEAVANTVRHAGATNATIRVTHSETDVSLVVTDDGCGFAVPRAVPGVGAGGLAAVRERVALLNGVFEVHSAPGRGSHVQVMIPISLLSAA